jgi:ATP-binding cassette subfamily C protein
MNLGQKRSVPRHLIDYWRTIGAPRGGAVVGLIVFAALAELLGLAALLPVAGSLFQGGGLYLGIAASALRFIGITTPSMAEFLSLVILMMLARGLALLTAYQLLAFQSTNLEAHSSIQLIRGILKARWEHVSRLGLGQLVDAITRLPSEAGAAGSAVANFMASLILACAFISTVAYVSAPTLLVALVIAIPLAWCLKQTSASTYAAYARLAPAQASKSKQAIELVQNAKFYKLGGAYRLGLSELETMIEQARAANLQAARGTAVMQTVPDTVVAIGIAALIAIVYGLKLDGGSNFVLSLMLMYRAFHYTNQTLSSAQTMTRYLPSFGALVGTIGAIESEQEAHLANKKAISFTDRIEFREVTFGYSPNRPILCSASLTIRRGDVVVIQGESGAGKTTTIDLLVGLLLPQEGEIWIDGQLLDNQSLESWREKVVYIPQEPPVFAGTVRSNLVMTLDGRRSLNDNDLFRALEIAQLDTVVRERPEGLDMIIGDRGISLSGGQRQRLLLARALLSEAEVIVLDEPTSAVDPQKEAIIFEKIFRQIRGEKTLIMAVHRLNLPRDVARTLKISQGKVTED